MSFTFFIKVEIHKNKWKTQRKYAKMCKKTCKYFQPILRKNCEMQKTNGKHNINVQKYTKRHKKTCKYFALDFAR